MRRYEYVVRSVGVHGPGPTSEEVRINRRIQGELDEMAAAGWRLVSATTAVTHSTGSGGTDWLRLIWEREKK